MTDKELRRLSRSELLEMLIAQAAENDQLKNRLEQAEAQLRDRKIAINNAGSLAEAALSLNGVFQAAEAAAQQYLENIERISGQQDAICRDMKEQAKQEAAKIRQEAQAYSEKAHAEADAYWKQIVAKAAKLLADQEVWDKSLRTMAAQKLTAQANEWLADNDQTDRNPEKDPITENEFARRILLTEFTVSPGGRFTAWYEDDDMFWGHVITVEGTLKKGPVGADIQG